MKNRYVILIFYFLSFPFLAGAQGNSDSASPFSFDLGAYLTVKTGHQGEYVYEPLANDRVLSYLEWDEKPLFVASLVGGAGYKSLRIQAEANVAIPYDSGTMADSDFMNVSDFPNCTDAIAGIKTKYTESLCTTNTLFSVQFQLAYGFNLNPVFSLVPFLGYDYQYSYQSAWGLKGFYYDEDYTEENGYYGWYTTSGHNYPVNRSKNIEVISLKRNYHMTWIGLSASFNLGNSLTLDASVAVSPFIAIKSYDNHILRNKIFFDDMNSFFSGGKLSAVLNYKINPHNSIYGKVGYLSTGIADGITYVSSNGAKSYTAYPSSHSGGDLQVWDFSFGYKYSF